MTYYVSGDGDDRNPGTHPLQAWKSIAKLNREKMRIQQNDQILFRRGYSYQGFPFYLNKRGIKIGAYGSGTQPRFPDIPEESG